MLADKQIHQQLKQTEGWGWITALKSEQIRKLLKTEVFELASLHQKKLLEVQGAEYPDERLIVCYNAALAHKRAQTRQFLLQATEQELAKIVSATQRVREPLQGKDKIALRVGKVVNRFKVSKHFQLTFNETHFSYQRNLLSIEQEADLDGIYVIRTSVTSEQMEATEVVAAYKSLSQVEQAFRCLKSVDLQIRPLFHRLEQRVKSHVLICFLAYHVEWHLRQALAPLLFAEEDPEGAKQRRSSIVEAMKKSQRTYRKATTKRSADNLPIHSFSSLLEDLATMTQNTIQPTSADLPCFNKLTQPTPLHRRVFELLQIPC